MIKLTPFTIDNVMLFSSWIKNAKEMIQFSGDTFSFPLSNEQIQKYLNDNVSYAFNVI